MTTIELKDYNLLGNLNDEESMLDEFFGNYSGSTYICDAIHEHVDGYIPIYYSDIWENAKDIQEYIEQAVSEGLVDVSSKNFDLMRMFQIGYYEFYSSSIYNNIEVLIYNKISNNINEYLNNLEEEDIDKIEVELIEEEIENVSDNYDYNNTFSEIEDEARRIIESIEDGEFNIDGSEEE